MIFNRFFLILYKTWGNIEKFQIYPRYFLFVKSSPNCICDVILYINSLYFIKLMFDFISPYYIHQEYRC